MLVIRVKTRREKKVISDARCQASQGNIKAESGRDDEPGFLAAKGRAASVLQPQGTWSGSLFVQECHPPQAVLTHGPCLQEWTSTYSDLGKCSEVPPKASSPSVDADLRSAKEKAYTHKIWAREHLQSTYRTDMTTTLQHAMKGVTDSSLKPGADPRQVLKLARQLHSVARARGRESRVGEALLALKQAKAMATSCIEAVQRGDDQKRRVGNKEIAVTINTPKGEHSATALDDVKGTPKPVPPGIERSAHELLHLITSDMLKMGVDGSRASTPQTPTITAGDKRATARGVASRGSESTDHDGSRSAPPRTKIASRRAPEEYLFGQISSSPIPGYPNSNRYMTEQVAL